MPILKTGQNANKRYRQNVKRGEMGQNVIQAKRDKMPISKSGQNVT